MTAEVAIVTGAARGIGLATARLLTDRGLRVAMVDRDTTALNAAAETVGGALAVPADISDPVAAAEMAAKTAERFGRIDHLVNNAGVAEFAPVEQTDFAMWRRTMATNLDGAFLCAAAALPHLKRRGGSIVNVASISGLRASTLRVAYGTSKAALCHLTRALAAELGDHGIRVNCVAPGPVRTKLAAAVHSPQIVAAYHDAIPLGRYGTEDEIARTISFLCSSDASYITGQILAADGGFEATGVGLPALRAAREE